MISAYNQEGFSYAVQSTARGDKGREVLIFRRLETVRNSIEFGGQFT